MVEGPAARIREPPAGVWGSVRELTVRTVKDSIDDRVPGLAAEVAFFTLLALPPLILAFFGVAGFIADAVGASGTETLRDWILEIADNILSQDTIDEAVIPTVDAVLEEGRADVAALGLVLAVWSGSRAMNVTLRAMTIAYDLEPRTTVKRRAMALGMTLVGMLFGLAVLPALVLGPQLGSFLDLPAFDAIWQVAYWPAMAVAVMAALATLYHFSIPWSTPWRRDLPGAVLAVVLWLGGAATLRLYAAWTIQADTTYGPLGTPIVVLLWLYLTALAVLAGAELNAEIERLWPRAATVREREAAKARSDETNEERDSGSPTASDERDPP